MLAPHRFFRIIIPSLWARVLNSNTSWMDPSEIGLRDVAAVLRETQLHTIRYNTILSLASINPKTFQRIGIARITNYGEQVS